MTPQMSAAISLLLLLNILLGSAVVVLACALCWLWRKSILFAEAQVKVSNAQSNFNRRVYWWQSRTAELLKLMNERATKPEPVDVRKHRCLD